MCGRADGAIITQSSSDTGGLDKVRDTSGRYHIPSRPLRVPLESNVIRESDFVRYGTPFYLNKVQLISGAAELSLELAADGTLTKAAAKAEEKAFEQVLGLLPTDKLLEKAKGAVAPAAAADQVTKIAGAAAGAIHYEFNLVAEQRYVRHIRFADVADRSFRPGLPLRDEGHWYRREAVIDLFSADKSVGAALPASGEQKQ